MKPFSTSNGIFQDSPIPKGTTLVGYSALIHKYNVEAPLRNPCCVAETHIHGDTKQEGTWLIYDKRYSNKDSLSVHLTFALKHENLDLLILKRVFQAVSQLEMQEFVLEALTGIYNRRGWFLYEFLLGNVLDIPDAAGNVPAVDLLNPKLYFVGKGTMSKRHRIRNNLLGTREFCPIVRKTKALEGFTALNLSEKAKEIVGRISTQLVARAASFLLLADSRASFEIEGERPPRERLEHWVKAVKQAGKYQLTLEEILRLQSILIPENRFIKHGLRDKGVFLGERDRSREPLPEFIGAKPDDLESLMNGLIQANSIILENGLDPVIHAAAIAFGFIYIHPLQDGNGRLHRYLIHHVLAEKKFTPPGLMFPVSSVMLERIIEYQETLQAHSGPLMDFIEWRATPDGNVEVTNDTADLYRFMDCTEEATFLYRCVQKTVEEDLPNEIEYLKRHDEAMRKIMDTVEMPNRLAEDFILFTRQNNGTLSKSRRKKEFVALTDKEISSLETIVQLIFSGFPNPGNG
ncbi:MAG: Fic family protein [Cyanobacteria bacterium]|nr:Fic family protein [Cyanobacteriota bacterium]